MSSPLEAFTLQSAGRRLPAVFHPADPCRAGLLFVHPFGEERKCAHRALFETARALAGQGVATLRFDLSGCGDAEGEFADACFADWITDIETAWLALDRRVGNRPLILAGLRMGASLASHACADLPNLSALVLWQPLVDGREEFTSDLRRLLIQDMITDGQSSRNRKEIMAQLEAGDGQVEMDGYPVTGALYRDICGIALSRDIPGWPRQSVLVQFSRPARRIAAFAEEHGVRATVVDVPPIWIRSDFLPTAETGGILMKDAVMQWVNPMGEPL